MHKKIFIFILMTLLIFALVACKSDDEKVPTELSQELVELLPNEGYQWAYIGRAEYYHEMRLESVSKDDSQAIYKVIGEVDDVSNSSSNTDYSIEIYYEINGNSIVQKKSAKAMLDSDYDQITLIKTPLKVGTEWSETFRDSSGKKQTIDAVISEIEEIDGAKVYKVDYRNKKANYSESRKIMEGIGVIAFLKATQVDGQKYSGGYGLYGPNSGYNAGNDTDTTDDTDTEDTSSDDTAEDTNTEDSDDDSSDDSNDDSNDDSTEDNNSGTDDSDDQDQTSTADEEQAVRDAITAFNNAWIEYVNTGDEAFFSFVVKNGPAYQNAINFDRTGLTEKFLVMQVNQVTVNGNVASAKVREEIEKTKNGEVTIAKYNWLYELVKKNGKWVINSYKKQ